MSLSVLQKHFPETLKRINKAIANPLVDDQGVVSRVLSNFKSSVLKETNALEVQRLKNAIPELQAMLKASVLRDIKKTLAS